MSNTVKHVSVMDLDFESVARLNDQNVLQRFQFVRRTSKKNGIPKTLNSNAYKVVRDAQAVTIHFLLFDREKNIERETFRFSFVPAPRFA
jgi:hypothetical protein